VMLDEDGDLFLNIVWLMFNDRDDFVDGFRDWDWNVFNDGNNNWPGYSDGYWDRVGLWYRYWLRHVDDVGLWYLYWVWNWIGFWDMEGFSHWYGFKDGIGCKDVFHDGNDHVFGDKLGHWKRSENWVRLVNGYLLVYGVRLRNGDVFRDVLHDNLNGSGVFYVTPMVPVTMSPAVAMSTVASGGDYGCPQKGH